jgi:hypothetical protein
MSQPVKMVSVDAKLFESVGYSDATRALYIKFRQAKAFCYKDVPRFRYQGLMNAPRKDAYFNTFIKNSFLAKEEEPPTHA